MEYNIAVIGASGSAGVATLQILAERNFPVKKLVAVASEKSIGRQVSFGDKSIKLQSIKSVDFSDIDIAVLCAGSAFSKKYAKEIAECGCTIIDKSPCFRMHPKVPLVVPEVNGDVLEKGAPLGMVATPNCVAVPLVMTLAALAKISAIKRVVISTYQSVSGVGHKGIDELYEQTKGIFSNKNVAPEVFPTQIAFNVIPLVGNIFENGISDEEDKISCEIRKILKSDIKSAVTCVRVPTFIGHAMSVACEFKGEVSEKDAYEAFENFSGILTIDRREEMKFVTPLDVQGDDGVYVSRVRRDESVPHGLIYWVAADNLRKGAALNSVQIAETMMQIDPTLKKFKLKELN